MSKPIHVVVDPKLPTVEDAIQAQNIAEYRPAD
jgi:hypothetical protein